MTTEHDIWRFVCPRRHRVGLTLEIPPGASWQVNHNDKDGTHTVTIANDQTAADAITAERDRLADALHIRRAHPDYEYDTTEGQRKAWDCHRPAGDGWERNITSEDPEAWERFDYTEECRWRRLKPAEPEKPAPADDRLVAALIGAVQYEVYADREEALRAGSAAIQAVADFFGNTWLTEIADSLDLVAA